MSSPEWPSELKWWYKYRFVNLFRLLLWLFNRFLSFWLVSPTYWMPHLLQDIKYTTLSEVQVIDVLLLITPYDFLAICLQRTEPQALTTQPHGVCAWTSALPWVVGFGDVASLAHTGTHKRVWPDFKGHWSLSTTLVRRAGGCPLLNDANTNMLNLTERGKRGNMRKKIQDHTDQKHGGTAR